MKQIIGISNLGGMGYYLDIGESLESAKNQTFNYISEGFRIVSMVGL